MPLLDAQGLPVAPAEQPNTAANFTVGSNFRISDGRGQVLLHLPKGIDPTKPITLMPQDAQILGARLMQQGERAICDAVFFRAALEIFEMDPASAGALLDTVGQGTRADHIQAFNAMRQGIKEQLDKDQPTEEAAQKASLAAMDVPEDPGKKH